MYGFEQNEMKCTNVQEADEQKTGLSTLYTTKRPVHITELANKNRTERH